MDIHNISVSISASALQQAAHALFGQFGIVQGREPLDKLESEQQWLVGLEGLFPALVGLIFIKREVCIFATVSLDCLVGAGISLLLSLIVDTSKGSESSSKDEDELDAARPCL